ncbi:WD40 repeat-like protein [Microstroma glucosiphilum]|uniref:WD40 repeat-like protein n=1 Tax=Pseudomicrostroma glucosiphilum TaxID=1684307 RepID=A0A316U2C2_9BASI|nr:WD40 repeat-like protein [Pseudomicrostroma glucosiphilum]PWN18968.1 WD40 repeat-like protein [Pseudomicrostroma glucosiphilum]
MDVDDAEDQHEGSYQRSLSPTSYLARAEARRGAMKPSSSLINAKAYSIEPVAALPHASHAHAMCLSGDGTVLLTGGSDGHVRRYDVYATMNGKSMLTVGARHGFVEGITRGGVLAAWWANEEHPAVKAEDDAFDERLVSAVHSLAIQKDALWSLSGTESGNINLTTVRHDPGTTHHVLRKHKGPVSALALTNGDAELVSGGWDTGVHQWDLNTGQVVRSYPGHAGQISSLSFRPLNRGESSSRHTSPVEGGDDADAEGEQDDDDDDQPLSRLAKGLEGEASGNNAISGNATAGINLPDTTHFSNDLLLTTTLGGQAILWDRRVPASEAGGSGAGSSGGIRALPLPANTPPWCASAAWAPDGERIYLGRRNESVEEWDMRMLSSRSGSGSDSSADALGSTWRGKRGNMGLVRTFKFPSGSGPVTSLEVMPNGRHLVCASFDNIRLWNLSLSTSTSSSSTSSSSHIPFRIVPGHQGGTVSALLLDSTGRFLFSASGDRAWRSRGTEMVLGHEVRASG